MAITVKDIHEKEFSKVYRGYSIEEVDDFLDAIAEQMEKLVRDMQASQAALTEARAEVDAAKSEAETARKAMDAAANEAEAVKADSQAVKTDAQTQNAEAALAPVAMGKELAPASSFNEPSYFKNLETTLRETLISAQRIADETIDDARKRARKIVGDAEEQASSIQEQSAARMAEAKADYDALKNASEDYRRLFSELIEGQSKLLKESQLFA